MKARRWDDHYTRRAREEKWLARSVYKLQEIDRKFRIIKRGGRLLDLGCYPGSWSQYGIRKVGSEGEVIGVDLVPPEGFSAANFSFIEADVLTLDMNWLAEKVGPVDVVLSDLAPKTTGMVITDESRSLSLARRALEIALLVLKKKGDFVCKVFEGEDFNLFKNDMSCHFSKIRPFRPLAVRKRSREVYLAGLGRG